MSKCVGAAYSPPCTTARRGGRAINKMSRSVRGREAGVVFQLTTKEENHPGCVCFGGFAKFINDAATPPCSDARRGINRSHTLRHFFHNSYDRALFHESTIQARSQTAPTVHVTSHNSHLTFDKFQSLRFIF